ncbi:MAG: DUF3575 domain-containing protein [Odoribacter sp.]|nr:DUF3575 domain-containing protein [Odoribacter sp.]
MLIILLLPVFTQAQEVHFSKDNLTIGEAFKEIEGQTEYLISYSIKNIDLHSQISLSARQLPIEKAMEEILNNLNYTSKIIGHHILIVPNPVTEAEIKKETPASQPKRMEGASVIDLEKLQKELDEYKQEYIVQAPLEPAFDITKYQLQRNYEEFINGKPAYMAKLPKVAIRTNLLYGLGALTPNGGIEIGLTPNSTLLLNGSYNAWKPGSDNEKLWHWSTGVEYRYWLCERFNGHFLGVHGFYGNYNISGKKIPILLEKGSQDNRYDGYGFGGGISYGYQFMLGKNWNLELNAGIGVGVLKYDKWESTQCGKQIEKGLSRTFVAPTKLGITLLYLIK